MGQKMKWSKDGELVMEADRFSVGPGECGRLNQEEAASDRTIDEAEDCDLIGIGHFAARESRHHSIS